jgi:hypothetical protein
MTFIDWFLIQSPDIKNMFLIKGTLLIIASVVFFNNRLYSDINRKLAIIAFIWGSLSTTIGSFLPDERQARKIIDLRGRK